MKILLAGDRDNRKDLMMVLPQSTRVKGFRIGQWVFEAGLQRKARDQTRHLLYLRCEKGPTRGHGACLALRTSHVRERACAGAWASKSESVSACLRGEAQDPI